ncbi:hypothetical protein ACWFMI_02295 [Nocardiopsis terrae]
MRTEGPTETPAPGTLAESGQRLLVPDLARGAMLLLIAVANTRYWFRQDPDAPRLMEDLVSGLLHLLVDARAYPLFALLLGFGLAVLAHRSVQAGLAAGLDREQAERHATALLRRRGLWLTAFGAVHALVFAQDVLGAYGLITITVAGIVTARRWRAALALAGVVCVLSTLFLLVVGPEAALDRGHGSAARVLFEEGLAGAVTNLAAWVVLAPATVLSSMALPGALLGAWLAGRGPIEQPHRHRYGLTALFLAGLVVPAVVTPVLWAGTDGTGALAGALVAWHQGWPGCWRGPPTWPSSPLPPHAAQRAQVFRPGAGSHRETHPDRLSGPNRTFGVHGRDTAPRWLRRPVPGLAVARRGRRLVGPGTGLLPGRAARGPGTRRATASSPGGREHTKVTFPRLHVGQRLHQPGQATKPAPLPGYGRRHTVTGTGPSPHGRLRP